MFQWPVVGVGLLVIVTSRTVGRSLAIAFLSVEATWIPRDVRLEKRLD
ncbi:hypothetical protein [Roseibium denhamense]|nr:hypothetical protein [Roseibium denhamense]